MTGPRLSASGLALCVHQRAKRLLSSLGQSCSHCLERHVGPKVGDQTSSERRWEFPWMWKLSHLRQAGGDGHHRGPEQMRRHFFWCRKVAQRFCNTLCLKTLRSFFSSCKHFPFLPLLAPKAAPVPRGRKSPVVAAGAAGTVLCLLTTGFVVGGFECPCLLKLQLRVSGCVWVSAQSSSHWTLDNLLCPVEVHFYSFVSSGGKK